jgi:hypothetical protein
MNSSWIQYGIYFLGIVLLQGLVINHIGIGPYAYPMIYTMLLIVLPFEINIILLLGIALLLGVSVDMLSDTFGLHTSSSIFIAYVRPALLNALKPRDGYDDNQMPIVHDMGFAWYAAYAGIFIVLHHTWFFVLEIFRFDMVGLILLKIIVSSLLSFVILMGLQFLLYKSSR